MEDYDGFTDLVDKIARNLVRDFTGCDREDIEQSLWVSILEAQSKGKLLSADEKYAESTLWYAGRLAAWNERKQHLTVSSQYGYRTRDVRALLETFFSREDWETAEVPEDAESELGNTGVEMSADLSRAFDKLEENHKSLILRYFGLRQDMDKAEKKKLTNAISRMADILNTYQGSTYVGGGPGSRRVLTSAHETSIIKRQEGRSG